MGRSPAGFLSYAHLDDVFEEGYITQLRERLEKEISQFIGEEFSIFQDRVDIRWGEQWSVRIEDTLSSATFLFPVLTPSFFRSPDCLRELQAFVDLERGARRQDLVLPIYYLESLALEEERHRGSHPLARVLSSRQYLDWRDLRGASFRDPRTRTRLTTMAKQVRDALDRNSEIAVFAGRDRLEVLESRTHENGPRSEVSTARQSSSPSAYEDFVLQISRNSEGDYILRVLSSPAGEGEAKVAGGYALAEIEEVRRVAKEMDYEDATPQDVERLGQRLYRLLAPETIGELLNRSLAQLDRLQVLRISLRLGLADPTVAPFWALPWEYLHLPGLGFLGLSRKCLVVHHWDGPLLSLPPVRVGPLNLLVVTLNSPSLPRLDLSREIEKIKSALVAIPSHVEVLHDGALESVRRALVDKEFHGVHFSGHGFFDRASGEGSLLFRDSGGAPRAVTGEPLASVLRDTNGPRFAVLNTSYSGRTEAINPEGGLAATLMRSGLSAVVAWQANMADDEAIAFSGSFYRRLAAGDPIEVAVVEGRLAIKLLNPEGSRWGGPVVYLRDTDSRLIRPGL